MSKRDTGMFDKGLTISGKGAAALAVGLGLGVCAAQPARAEVFYSGPQGINIEFEDYELDVDEDGNPDFVFSHGAWGDSEGVFEILDTGVFSLGGYYATVSAFNYGSGVAGKYQYYYPQLPHGGEVFRPLRHPGLESRFRRPDRRIPEFLSTQLSLRNRKGVLSRAR